MHSNEKVLIKGRVLIIGTVCLSGNAIWRMESDNKMSRHEESEWKGRVIQYIA